MADPIARRERGAREFLACGVAVRSAWSAWWNFMSREVAQVLREERTSAEMPAVLLARTLQAQGIWFQLLAIAEQNRDMRNRREVERERGYDRAARHISRACSPPAAAEGVTGAQIRRGARRAADPACDHRASDRSEARDGARAAPAHLSQAARARVPALDRARAAGSDSCPARRDRASVAHGRTEAVEADGRAGGRLGALFFQ